MNVGKKLRIAELEASVFELRGRVESLSREVRGLHEDRIRAQAVREAMRKERKEGAVTAGVGVKPGIYYWDSGGLYAPDTQDQGMAEMPTPRQTVDHEDFATKPDNTVNSDGIRKDSPMAKGVEDDGPPWLNWRGVGPGAPYHKTAMVDVRLHSGVTARRVLIEDCNWDHRGMPGDIVAYRLSK